MLRTLTDRYLALPTPASPLIDGSLLLGRVLTIPALVHAGFAKVPNFEAVAQAMAGDAPMLRQFFPDQTPLFHFPAAEMFLAFAILFDFAGSLLLMLGLWTRLVAMLLLTYVVAAVAIFHSDIRTTNDVLLLVVNAPLLGCLIMLTGIGGGGWSLDGAIAQFRRAQSSSSFPRSDVAGASE